MVLKLRLARIGTPGGSKRHHPRYNIVLAQARTARDSKPLEVLGTYNPIPELPVGAEPGARKQKDIKLDVSRAKYWLGVGAQPTDTVWRLLSMIGLLEPKFLPSGPQTLNALKAVRFATHTNSPNSKAKQSTKNNTSSSEKKKTSNPRSISDELLQAENQSTSGAFGTGEGEIQGEVAGTTSPQNPNAA